MSAKNIDWSKLLNFFNLLDSEGKLSITNAAVYIVLYKLAISPNPSLLDAGALLITFLNYMHKRQTISNTTPEPEINVVDSIAAQKAELETLRTKMDEVTSKVAAVVLSSGMRNL